MKPHTDSLAERVPNAAPIYAYPLASEARTRGTRLDRQEVPALSLDRALGETCSRLC